MKTYLDWSLEKIRALNIAWMEERRLEWDVLMQKYLRYLEEGKTFVIICDEKRAWFENYILSNINSNIQKRPFLPFVSLRSFFSNIDNLKTNQDFELLDDMLSITFPQGYVYFYIGTSLHKNADIAQSKQDSFMWIFDEKIQNSFYIYSKDARHDIRLIELFTFFNHTIDAFLQAEIILENE